MPAAAAIAMALLGLAAGCQSARQVDATPPTVSYSYAEGGESETWEHAQDHCANYGLEPVVISRDPEQRYVAYACE